VRNPRLYLRHRSVLCRLISFNCVTITKSHTSRVYHEMGERGAFEPDSVRPTNRPTLLLAQPLRPEKLDGWDRWLCGMHGPSCRPPWPFHIFPTSRENHLPGAREPRSNQAGHWRGRRWFKEISKERKLAGRWTEDWHSLYHLVSVYHWIYYMAYFLEHVCTHKGTRNGLHNVILHATSEFSAYWTKLLLKGIHLLLLGLVWDQVCIIGATLQILGSPGMGRRDGCWRNRQHIPAVHLSRTTW